MTEEPTAAPANAAAGRDAFASAEWQVVAALPIVVAALISAVDFSQLSERREYEAFRAHLKRLAAKRTRSRLVADAVADAVDDLDEFERVCRSVAAPEAGGNPAEERLKAVQRTLLMVESRVTAREARVFKSFVYDVGVAVARAHRESLLPLTSPISHREDFWLRRLRKALHL